MYDINALNNIVAQFNDIVNAFGWNQKSLDYFISTLDNQVSNKMLPKNEVEVIKTLFGKGCKADKDVMDRIKQFTHLMDIIITNRLTDRPDMIINVLSNMKESYRLSTLVKSAIYKIFNVTEIDINKLGASSFGTHNFTPNVKLPASESKPDRVINTISEMGEFISKLDDKSIRVVNKYGCSGDPMYYSCGLKYLTRGLTGKARTVAELIIDNANFEVGDYKTSLDASTKLEVNKDITSILKNNFEIFRKYLIHCSNF